MLAVTATIIANRRRGGLRASSTSPGAVRTVIAVIAYVPMRGRDNHVRFSFMLKFLSPPTFSFFSRFTKLNIGEIFRVAYFRRVIGG